MNPDTLIQRGNAGYSKQQKQLRDAKPVQAPVTPVTPAKQYNAGGGVINPYGTAPIVSPNAPITSATMAPSTPVTLPTQIQPTAAAGMAGAVEATNKSVAQQRAEALTAQQENEVASRGNLNNQLLNEMMGVNTEMTNASASIDRTEQNKLREESDSLTRQIEMEQESTRQKVNALREANPQGLFGGALQDEMERLQRDSGNRLATLAIQRSAAMRDFATADSIANEQLRLKLEPLKLKSDNLKLFYEDNKDRFNKADDRLFAEVTRKAEQEYKKAEAVETALSETRLTALKSASEQNAPSSVLQAIQKANTQEEVIAAAGKYGGDVQKRELLAQQIKTEKAQRENINSQISARNAELSGEKTKPATAAQFTAGGYASRTVQAESILQKNKEAISSFEAARYAAARNLPNSMQPPVVQEQLQAERNFINAVLRRESGAAISPEEFESASKQYFPQPGDSPGVLLNKEQNRALVQQNLIRESGSAYVPPANEFQQALGVSTEKIPGTNIIQSTGADGSINFALPK